MPFAVLLTETNKQTKIIHKSHYCKDHLTEVLYNTIEKGSKGHRTG